MTRFLEIDIIKGIAVTTMIVFHYFYLSNYMNLSNYNIDSGILFFLAKFSHIIFIIMVGVNLSISYERNKQKDKPNQFYRKQLIRAVKLFIAGIIITLISKSVFGDDIYVKFGIFHFIAISIIISMPIIKSKMLILMAFAIILTLNLVRNYFYTTCLNYPFSCFIVGVQNIKYSALDHFSIIKYYGYICIGLLLGKYVYQDNQRILNLPQLDKTQNKLIKLIAYLGRNSFNIYFLHFILFYYHFYGNGGVPKTYI